MVDQVSNAAAANAYANTAKAIGMPGGESQEQVSFGDILKNAAVSAMGVPGIAGRG